MRPGRARRTSLGVVLTLMMTGCGVSIPADPDDTLADVRASGVVQVGASPRPGWVEITADDRPTGREPDLVERFAKHLGVEVEWVVTGEEQLVSLLEDGSIDLAVGGVTDDNAWVAKAAFTRPYVEVPTDEGVEAHVMMAPMGENAWLSTLERWLDAQRVRP